MTGADLVLRFERGEVGRVWVGSADDAGGLSVSTSSGPNTTVRGRTRPCGTLVSSASSEISLDSFLANQSGFTGKAEAGGVAGRKGAWTGC
jgi:hypothetical protein